MREYLFEIYRSLTETTAHEASGGLLLGLALAFAGSGAWMLARKRVADPMPLLCGLILMVSALSMAVGLGHSRYKLNRTSRMPMAHDPSPGFRKLPPAIGHRLLQDADSDGDGRLTPEEAARFVKEADLTGKGWADASDIDRARDERIGTRSILDFHPDSARPSPPRPGF